MESGICFKLIRWRGRGEKQYWSPVDNYERTVMGTWRIILSYFSAWVNITIRFFLKVWVSVREGKDKKGERDFFFFETEAT